MSSISVHWEKEVGKHWMFGQGMISTSSKLTLEYTSSATQVQQIIRSQGSWISYSHDSALHTQEWKALDALLHDNPEKRRGSCYFWAGSHYRMFDGNLVSLPTGCEHILLMEPRDQTIKISVLPQETCSTCIEIKLELETVEYILAVDARGRAVATSGASSIAVPGVQDGVVFQKSGSWIFVEMLGLGLTLRWNSKVAIA